MLASGGDNGTWDQKCRLVAVEMENWEKRGMAMAMASGLVVVRGHGQGNCRSLAAAGSPAPAPPLLTGLVSRAAVLGEQRPRSITTHH